MTTRSLSLQWEPYTPPPDPGLVQHLASKLKLRDPVCSILLGRGLTTVEDIRAYLNPAAYQPSPPSEMPDALQAAERLAMAVASRERILLWGDFDVDGLTATVLLREALLAMGGDVAFYIPDRYRESHGMSRDALRRQFAAFSPALLLTCDTGTFAFGGIDYAKSQGVAVIVTDHHSLLHDLPPADAIVNPKRLSSDHPLYTLSGAGVAYKLVEQIQQVMGHEKGFAQRLLDLVALGIIANATPLVRDARYLTQLGIQQLRVSEREGLRELFRLTGISQETLSESDIAFHIAPRLNAASRAGNVQLAVDLLLTTNNQVAQRLALQLEAMNNRRRLEESQTTNSILEQIKQDSLLLDWHALIAARAGWNPGILGSVANRLVEQFERPVILLTIEGERARGSARSMPGINLIDVLHEVSDLLIAYGGHEQAAGLSLPANNIPAFRHRVSDAILTLKREAPPASRSIEGWLTLPEITLQLANDFQRLAPFGNGNPRPLLAVSELSLRGATFLDRGKKHRRLTVEDREHNRRHIIWWNSQDRPLPEGIFDLAFELGVNTRGAEPEPQLQLVAFRPSPSAPAIISEPVLSIIDLRQAPHPKARLKTLNDKYPDAIVWAEGFQQSKTPGIPLSQLDHAPQLIVFTTPHSAEALNRALDKVKPIAVIILGVDPPYKTVPDILRRLASLIKYVVKYTEGRTTIQALAEAVAHSPTAVRVALDLLESRGDITFTAKPDGSLVLTRTSRPAPAEESKCLTRLQKLVSEANAYRAFFKRAAMEDIVREDPTK